jgi:predicted metal-dependent HD superfamily phosphohydrolase
MPSSMNLRDYFFQVCLPFNQDKMMIENFWVEIEKKYSEKGRHYHNLTHLENMFSELEIVKDRIVNFTNISFSVFYHDVIYDASSKLNEEKSEEFAKLKLEKLGLNKTNIKEISAQILATKSHQKSENNDINYLLDADLSILGKDIESYIKYTQQIRKEYSMYSDLLYKPGRRKVLQHFLELEGIFKTEYFRDRYEAQTRGNIEFEIGQL